MASYGARTHESDRFFSATARPVSAFVTVACAASSAAAADFAPTCAFSSASFVTAAPAKSRSMRSASILALPTVTSACASFAFAIARSSFAARTAFSRFWRST